MSNSAKPRLLPIMDESYEYWDCYMLYKKKKYAVAELIECSKQYPVQYCPIEAIRTDYDSVDDGSYLDFVQHAKRVMEADTTFPILLARDGYILDGRHRLAKMMIDGVKQVPFIRLRTMPGFYK